MKKFILILVCAISINISYAQENVALRNYIAAAGQAMDNQKTDEAIALLKNAANVAPNNFVPRYLLGQAYMYTNDNDNAVKCYTEVLSLINTNTISQKYYECFGVVEDVSYRKIMTDVYEVLAEHYRKAGQLRLAKRYNNLNIQLNVASGYTVPVASSLERIYLCYAEEGKWSDCLDYFIETLEVIPHGDAWKICEAVCHAVMGDCYANLGQEREMIIEYQQAARLGHINAINTLKNAGINY